MTDVSSILGGGAFLGASAGLLYGGALFGVVREALYPERRTVGWALARGTPTEPSHWGLPAREWSHGFDGASCPVFDLGDEDPGSPTAIVIHGFARSRYDALARLEPLFPHARRFILPDLPGHGDSIGRSTRLGTDEDAFLESLVTTATTGPVLLVGHSLGGSVALQLQKDRDIPLSRTFGAPVLDFDPGITHKVLADRFRHPLRPRLYAR